MKVWATFPAVQRVWGSAVAWSFLATGLRLGGAVLVLPLVLRHLPSEQLGLWYVFLSLSSVVLVIADAGFGATFIRSMGYLWQGVSELRPTGLVTLPAANQGPSTPNFPLLADLVATMNWYYRAVAVAVLIGLLGPGSWWLWRTTAPLADAASIRGAWLLFSFGTALNLAAVIWSVVLVGINGVRLSEQIFSRSLLLNYTIVVGGLLVGWGLWAMVAGQIVQGVIIRCGGKRGFLHLVGQDYRQQRGRPTPDLVRTLWPMSWRTALMGLGSCLILYSNTLVCSSFLGFAETGSYGMTFQLVTAVSGVSAIWVTVKLPVMNQLRAAGETAALSRLFIQRMRLSLVTYAIGALGLIFLGPWFVQLIGSKTPMLAPGQTATLLLVMLLTTHQSQHASLVLSENRNPFVLPMVLTGLGIASLSLLLVPQFGVWGLVISLGAVQLVFMNWWTVLQGLKSLQLSPSRFLRGLLGGESA